MDCKRSFTGLILSPLSASFCLSPEALALPELTASLALVLAALALAALALAELALALVLALAFGSLAGVDCGESSSAWL